jgi:acetyl-CoA acetyltransferase
MCCCNNLGLDCSYSQVNVNGGAIAITHALDARPAAAANQGVRLLVRFM